MGACGSTNKKPVNIGQAQEVPKIEPSRSKPEKQIPESKALPTDNTKSAKIINVKIIKEGELNLNNSLFEKNYEETTSFTQVIRDLNTTGKIDRDSDYNYYLSIFNSKTGENNLAPSNRFDLSGKTNDSLKNILTKFNRVGDSNAIFEISSLGLKIPQNVRNAYLQQNTLISTPKYDNDPFGVNVYDKATSTLKYHSIPGEVSPSLKVFNNFSAYCNGRNKLYISGGITDDNVLLGEFIEIDLEKINASKNNDTNAISHDYIRTLPNLITARGWHSMIFIPNKYIFIVGGSNTNSVELYDIETNKITHDSDLVEKRSETSLCCVDNSYLYAFCGFQFLSNFTNTIERCNLKKSVRTWERITINNSLLSIEPNFYTIAFGKSLGNNQNEIILMGANENYSNKQSGENKKKKNYAFKQIGSEDYSLVEQEIKEIDQPCVCSEKFFFPYDERCSILMPTYVADSISMLIFNAEEAKLNEIKFEPVNDQEEVYVIEINENREKVNDSQCDAIGNRDPVKEVDQKASRGK